MIEEKKIIEKPIEKKPVLNIKIDTPKNSERREEKDEDGFGKSSIGAMGVVLLSKKKTKNWLHVPARAKSKTPLFPEKETEVVPVVPALPVLPVVQNREEEEVADSDDPVVIRGAKVNLLGKYDCLEGGVVQICHFCRCQGGGRY